MAVPCQSISRPRSAGSSIARTAARANQGGETERDALLAAQKVALPGPAAMLLDFNGIGPEFTAVLWSEGLFRHFDNRRQVAFLCRAGADAWQSGSVDHEAGSFESRQSSIADNTHSLAWLWLRHQPQSALALWFKERVARNGGRHKKDDRSRTGAQAAGGTVEIMSPPASSSEGAVMKTA